MNKEIYLELQDNQWPLEYIDHDRECVRGIVYDSEGYLYFVRVETSDIFGQGVCLETSGGGLEAGEEYTEALKRELREELGVIVDVEEKIGVISDYYNIMHRHNINNYYLCRVKSFCERELTDYEKTLFHLTAVKMRYETAFDEYVTRSNTKKGKLIAKRELPVLIAARKLLKERNISIITPLPDTKAGRR